MAACPARPCRRHSLACAVAASLAGWLSAGALAAEQDSAVDDEDMENIVVTGSKLPETPLGLYLDAEMLTGIPGVNDDPLQAIITLPGVAVNNDFQGGVAVRGTRPVDNTYRIDFMQVGYLFHFGTGSVVDGDVVEGFSFLPAGYSARFGDVIGGAVDVRTRDPASDKVGGLLDVNLVHAGALFEGPISDTQRAYFSGRVSYYDLILEPFIENINDQEEDDVDLVQLPKFYDYRGRYQVDVGDTSRLDFFLDGSSDEVELLFRDESTEVMQDPALAGAHRFALEYHRQAVVFGMDARARSGLERPPVEVGFARNQTTFTARLGGAGDVNTVVTDNSLRAEATLPALGVHEFSVGTTLSYFDVDYDVVLRDAGCTEFEVDCRFTDAEEVTTRDRLQFSRARVFVDDTLSLGERLRVTLGVALTADDYLERSAVEPRAAVTWQWRPRTTLMMAAGRYHQLPAFEYIEETLGNPSLQYLEADHFVVGVEHLLANGWQVKADVYRKDSRNLVTANELTRYDNRGEGEAVGAELMLRGHFGPRWLGWASLSYAKAERRDLDTGRTFDFAFDQPVIASLVAKFQMNERLSFSGKAWYHSGAPHSPILGGIPDPDNEGAFLPVYGEVNSERLPSYFRLDLRADWTLEKWNDALLYFEIQNATNHRNVSDYEYEADYSSREPVTQVPLFVSVGFRKGW
ncbi:MAG: TonB-dependent receptor [Pseudomonadota bacterium]